MAAAGLTAAMGGNPRQIENAAEIAVELPRTTDLLVNTVPHIERTGMGRLKPSPRLISRSQGTVSS